MAAISGIVKFDGNPVEKSQLLKQDEVLSHRGRTGWTYVKDGVGLSYRDSGLEPSANPTGRPVADLSGRYTMVACGSIFNEAELRNSMASGKQPVPGLSNHEVIVNAFAAWGPAAFRRMNGSFALAIWDGQARELILARDALGLRQLFFGRFGNTVIFGSEAKSILCCPSVSVDPDPVGIANYLAVNRYLFQTKSTFYRGINRVLPAQAVTEGSTGSRSTTYWHPQLGQSSGGLSDEDLVGHVRELMIDSVRIRSQNQQTGAALSGGFDSSSIVCMLAECRDSPEALNETLHTFSFDFASEDADELELINAVSKAAGTTHHHINALTPALLDDLDDLIAVHDGPVIESSTLLLWAKKRCAEQQGIKVLLSGLGGDEVFMGTQHYLSDLLVSARLPSFMRAFRAAYPMDLSSGSETQLSTVVKAYVLSPLIPAWMRSIRKRSAGQHFPPNWIQRDLAEKAGFGELPASDVRASSAFEQEQYDLFKFELLGGAIPYHEETSSAHGIDTRFPLLDFRLVELLFDVERRWKLDGPNIRHLQRAAMKEFLPREVSEDHLKKNFHHALNRYLRSLYSGPYQEFVSRSRLKCAEFVDMSIVRDACRGYLDGSQHDATAVWLAFNLEKWLSKL